MEYANYNNETLKLNVGGVVFETKRYGLFYFICNEMH